MSRPKNRALLFYGSARAGPVHQSRACFFLLHNPKKEGINFIKFIYTNKRDTAKIYLNYDENQ
jgi:hypothetical protein